MTHSFLQLIPVRRGIIENAASQWQCDFAKEIVAAEHITMPDGQPQSAVLKVR